MKLKEYNTPHGTIRSNEDGSMEIEKVYSHFGDMVGDEDMVVMFLVDEGYIYKESKIFMNRRDRYHYYSDEWDEEVEEVVTKKQYGYLGPQEFTIKYYFNKKDN